MPIKVKLSQMMKVSDQKTNYSQILQSTMFSVLACWRDATTLFFGNIGFFKMINHKEHNDIQFIVMRRGRGSDPPCNHSWHTPDIELHYPESTHNSFFATRTQSLCE